MELSSSKHLNKAAAELAKLPGIGKKSALRLALHLLRKPEIEVESFTSSISSMRKEIRFCKQCHNISDLDECSICANPTRNNGQLCVIEDLSDIMAIERTGEFNGRYHVLGGVISPMDGIGPENLNISTLFSRLEREDINELILALPTTVEGDTTNFYLYKKLTDYNLRVTTLARGVSIGDALEYIDELTLGRSIQNRLPFNQTMKRPSIG
jgi:recombination protein RecR